MVKWSLLAVSTQRSSGVLLTSYRILLCLPHSSISSPPLCHDSGSGSDLHLLYNLLPLLPQPLSIMLCREKPFWKSSSSSLPVVCCCPQSSQSHLRHVLSSGSICSWGCSSSCCNHTKNHKEKQLEIFTQPLQFPGLPLQQLHDKGNHSPSASLTPPDTRTSRLTSGLHCTGGKKTILPPLLLLLRLLFLSACSSTQTAALRALYHRHQSAVTVLICCCRG